MKKGELEYAIRQAHNRFDQWNDATGIFDKHTGYYYEALATIEDAVKIGAMVSSGMEIKYDDCDQLIEEIT